MNEPQLFKSGDPRVIVNGLPLQFDGRFLPESLYQELKSGHVFSELKTQRKTGITLPAWLLLVIVLILIFGTLWFSDYFKGRNVEKAEREKAAIESKIDSVEATKNTNRETFVNNSIDRANKSNNITKHFTDEKIIIRDTTYSVMCDYIRSYRAE